MADFVLAQDKGAVSEWGPVGGEVPSELSTLPFAPFSVTAKLGKVADVTAPSRGHRSGHAGSGAGGNPAFRFDRTDDSSFVATAGKAKAKTNKTVVARRVFTQRMVSARSNNDLLKRRRGVDRPQRGRRQKLRANAMERRSFGPQKHLVREASTTIGKAWEEVGEIKFKRLGAEAAIEVPEGTDVRVAGVVETPRADLNKIDPGHAKPLPRSERAFYRVTTSRDPALKQLRAAHPEATVIGFDTILATLMVAPASVQSWDVRVRREGERTVVFDLPEENVLYTLPMHETAPNDQQLDDRESINAPHRLSQEAAYVQMMFSQAALDPSTRRQLQTPDPFNPRRAEKGETAAGAFRYRRFTLPDGNVVLCRCAVSGAVPGAAGEQLVSVLSMLDYDTNDYKKRATLDWRASLGAKVGAVVMSEMKNNTRRFATQACAVALAEPEIVKMGFVGRVRPTDPFRHEVLHVQTYQRAEFLRQMNVNLSWAWGVLSHIVERLQELPEGEYCLMRDPHRPTLVIYAVHPDPEPQPEAPASEAEDLSNELSSPED